MLRALGWLDETSQAFRLALQAAPQAAEAHHAPLADLPAAKAALERALQLRPQSLEARFSTALLLFRQGNYHRA